MRFETINRLRHLSFAMGMSAMLTVLASSAESANAFSLNFEPAGRQGDGDEMVELKRRPGSLLNFELILDTQGITKRLGSVSYMFEFDNTEMSFVDFSPLPNPSQPFFQSNTPTLISNENGWSKYQITQSDGNLAKNAKFSIGEIVFRLSKTLQNDGKADFRLTLLGAADRQGNAFTNVRFGQEQEAEVQSMPTPAMLPGVIAMGVGAIKRRKSKLNSQAA